MVVCLMVISHGIESVKNHQLDKSKNIINVFFLEAHLRTPNYYIGRMIETWGEGFIYVVIS